MSDSDISDQKIMANLAKTVGVFMLLTVIGAATLYLLLG